MFTDHYVTMGNPEISMVKEGNSILRHGHETFIIQVVFLWKQKSNNFFLLYMQANNQNKMKKKKKNIVCSFSIFP